MIRFYLAIFISLRLTSTEAFSSFPVATPPRPLHQLLLKTNRVPASPASTLLHGSSGQRPDDAAPAPFLDLQLASRLALTQAIVGVTVYNDGWGETLLKTQVHLDSPNAWLLGVIGSLPICAVGAAIERSDSPLFQNINLSTNALVTRLFGTKAQPVFALAVSVILCGLTGVVEEVLFRGGIVPSTAQWAAAHGVAFTSGDGGAALSIRDGLPFGVVASSIFFSVGHLNFLSRAFVSRDTLVLFLLQLYTGLCFAGLYVATGDLTVPILAHFLYDLFTFYETHLTVTDQILYSEQPFQWALPKFSTTTTSSSSSSSSSSLLLSPTVLKWRLFRGKEFVVNVRRQFLLMDTDRDGVVSRSELRIGLYGLGLRLVDSDFSSADADGSGQIDFDEFLDFVATARTEAAETINNASLLGGVR